MKKHKPVTTDRAIRWAGSRTLLAVALGISPQAIGRWGKYPPVRRQIQIRNIYEPKGARVYD